MRYIRINEKHVNPTIELLIGRTACCDPRLGVTSGRNDDSVGIDSLLNQVSGDGAGIAIDASRDGVVP